MSLWRQARLIDIFSQMDMELAADEIPEGDIQKEELLPYTKPKRNKKRIAIVSGIAVTSAALTAAVALLVCKKHARMGSM